MSCRFDAAWGEFISDRKYDLLRSDGVNGVCCVAGDIKFQWEQWHRYHGVYAAVPVCGAVLPCVLVVGGLCLLLFVVGPSVLTLAVEVMLKCGACEQICCVCDRVLRRSQKTSSTVTPAGMSRSMSMR